MIFNLKGENLNSTIFCQIRLGSLCKGFKFDIQTKQEMIRYQLSLIEQQSIIDALHEMLIEESNASI